MNYLAHFLLSHESADEVLGALLGDFVKGRLDGRLPAPLEAAIRLHRRIDTFTDAHPAHIRSRSRVAPERRRYAGMIIDLAYDQALARAWPDYATVPLADFCTRIYGVLHHHRGRLNGWLPTGFVHRMRTANWLMSYRETDGVARALRGMSMRVSRVNPLAEGIRDISAANQAIRGDFAEFFPDLQIFAAQERKLIKNSMPPAGPRRNV